MKKIALVIISILFLSGLVYSQEAPKDGIIKEHYESGQLKSEGSYKEGELTDSKGYDEKGKLVFSSEGE